MKCCNLQHKHVLISGETCTPENVCEHVQITVMIFGDLGNESVSSVIGRFYEWKSAPSK